MHLNATSIKPRGRGCGVLVMLSMFRIEHAFVITQPGRHRTQAQHNLREKDQPGAISEPAGASRPTGATLGPARIKHPTNERDADRAGRQ